MEENRTPEILEYAAELVESGWSQEYPAVDKDGSPTAVNADDARAWCVVGALRKAATHRKESYADTFNWGDYNAAIVMLAETVGAFRSIPQWNDDPNRTQEEVAAKLRETAERARAA